ncbi:MAG TPA: hypothetical protein VGN01_14395 [Acidobacteriaceae bacterium]
MNIRAVVPFLVLLALPVAAQTPAATPAPAAPATTPVGHWVAEHTSQGGIGTWWDFRADGTFTVHIGAMVTAPVTHTADTLTLPPATANGAPVQLKYVIVGDELHLKGANSPEQLLTRVGPAPSATDPLLGKWRPAPPAVVDPDPKKAALQKATANGIFVFSADGTQSVRVPFSTREGTWSATAHTFQFNGQPATYSIGSSGDKLVLGQPPDNTRTDTYLPDPIL